MGIKEAPGHGKDAVGYKGLGVGSEALASSLFTYYTLLYTRVICILSGPKLRLILAPVPWHFRDKVKAGLDADCRMSISESFKINNLRYLQKMLILGQLYPALIISCLTLTRREFQNP